MSNYKNDLEKMLRNVRVACGLRHRDVANFIGINRATYSYYENGATSPDIPTLHKLAQLFDIPVEAFLYPEKYADMPLEKIRVRDKKIPLPDPQRMGELTKEEKALIVEFRVGKRS